MSNMHTVDEMPPSLKHIIENLGINEFSSPVIMMMPDETQAYRILKVNERIDSHMANLIDDFSMIKDFAISIKQQEEIMLWIEEAIRRTYIRINDDLLSCTFKNKWVK